MTLLLYSTRPLSFEVSVDVLLSPEEAAAAPSISPHDILAMPGAWRACVGLRNHLGTPLAEWDTSLEVWQRQFRQGYFRRPALFGLLVLPTKGAAAVAYAVLLTTSTPEVLFDAVATCFPDHNQLVARTDLESAGIRLQFPRDSGAGAPVEAPSGPFPVPIEAILQRLLEDGAALMRDHTHGPTLRPSGVAWPLNIPPTAAPACPLRSVSDLSLFVVARLFSPRPQDRTPAPSAASPEALFVEWLTHGMRAPGFVQTAARTPPATARTAPRGQTTPSEAEQRR